MSKENPESSPSTSNFLEDSLQKDAEAYRRLVYFQFKERYSLFKKKTIKSQDLYVGDFRPQLGLTSNSPLQILLPIDTFVTISHEDIFAKFVKTFSKDLKSGGFKFETGKEVPQAKTTKLKKLVSENPDKQLPFVCFKYELKSESSLGKLITMKRYFEDFTLEKPISEIWTASRYTRA